MDLNLLNNRSCYSLIDEQLVVVVVVVVVELVMNFCLNMVLHTVVATPMGFASIKSKSFINLSLKSQKKRLSKVQGTQKKQHLKPFKAK